MTDKSKPAVDTPEAPLSLLTTDQKWLCSMLAGREDDPAITKAHKIFMASIATALSKLSSAQGGCKLENMDPSLLSKCRLADGGAALFSVIAAAVRACNKPGEIAAEPEIDATTPEEEAAATKAQTLQDKKRRTLRQLAEPLQVVVSTPEWSYCPDIKDLHNKNVMEYIVDKCDTVRYALALASPTDTQTSSLRSSWSMFHTLDQSSLG